MRLAGKFSAALLVFAFASACQPVHAMISVKTVTKEQAKGDLGITMHAAKKGDAGIKVWIQFAKDDLPEKFAYAELKIEDAAGNHLLSAQLEPNPANHRRPKNATTVAFSIAANQLRRCSFFVVCSDGNRGHSGYILRVTDFLEPRDLGMDGALDGRWKQTDYIASGKPAEAARWYLEFDAVLRRYDVFNSAESQSPISSDSLEVDPESTPTRIELSPLNANGPTRGNFKIDILELVLALANDFPTDFEPCEEKHIYIRRTIERTKLTT